MLSSAALALSLAPALASAYSYTFGSTPTQCENATINIVGDDGVPPYNVVILAYGHPPGGNEVRKIIDHSWDGKSTSVQIAFPSNSQFIAVVSDSKTVGSGGTSVSVNVAASDDDSCLPKTVSPAFFLFVGDETTSADDPEIDQCSPIRLAWSNTATNPVSIMCVIPGGNSFAIDTSAGKDIGSGQIGFQWTPDVPQFTDIILVAGDASGRGSGGSTGIINIGGGTKDCLTGTYPSSTPGTPAGGVYATNSNGGKSQGGGTDIGAIVGGVIGGLVFIIIVLAGLLFWFWRRRRAAQRIKEKPDLADDPTTANQLINAQDDPHHQLPAGYEPEPFIVPPSRTSGGSRPGTPTTMTGGMVLPASAAWQRRLSNNSASQSGLRQSTEGGDSSTSYGAFSDRKHYGGPGPLRPVNIIQHDDGGAVSPDGEAETVELPPAYGNIRPSGSATPAAPPPPA
ncbi:hypothetical protein AURDEDRAFT_111821 [Auricularia subglabra TFB-10046 SS5]|nr:hypothetical protein AURDEDRAFT_111821 [Auricularia subglabra TFB-10046 SS5]